MGTPATDLMNYVRSNLPAEYSSWKFYDYDPRARKVDRPYIAFQYRGYAPSVVSKTINPRAFDHLIDIIVGVEESDPVISEQKIFSVCKDIINVIRPYSHICGNSYIVTSIDYMHEAESSSRLRDEGQLLVRLTDSF